MQKPQIQGDVFKSVLKHIRELSTTVISDEEIHRILPIVAQKLVGHLRPALFSDTRLSGAFHPRTRPGGPQTSWERRCDAGEMLPEQILQERFSLHLELNLLHPVTAALVLVEPPGAARSVIGWPGYCDLHGDVVSILPARFLEVAHLFSGNPLNRFQEGDLEVSRINPAEAAIMVATMGYDPMPYPHEEHPEALLTCEVDCERDLERVLTPQTEGWLHPAELNSDHFFGHSYLNWFIHDMIENEREG